MTHLELAVSRFVPTCSGPCEQHLTVRRSLVECLGGPGRFVAACACFLHSPPDSGHVSQHSSRPCCHSSHPLAPHWPRLCCCEADLWALIVIPRPKPQARRQAPTESPWKRAGTLRPRLERVVHEPLSVDSVTLRPQATRAIQQPNADGMRSPDVSTAVAAAGGATEACRIA